jgi:hypothetical protein
MSRTQIHDALMQQIIAYGGAEAAEARNTDRSKFAHLAEATRAEFARVLDLAAALRDAKEG